MDTAFITIFTAVAALLAAVDLYYAYKAFQRPEKIGTYLGLSALAAGIVTLSYMLSLHTSHYRVMSAASSVYFAAIDWMLVALVHFTYLFTDMHTISGAPRIRRIIRAYAMFDTLMMAVNIFWEIVVSYVPWEGDFLTYSYNMKPLYIMHLIFTYFLIGLIIYILVDKCRSTPRQYRNQYIYIILAIGFVVAVNALYLFVDRNETFTRVDCSIFGYSIGFYILYWAAFRYRENDMLKSLSMMIFSNIEQGIVLFDYTDLHIMHNRRAEQLLGADFFQDRMTSERFLEHFSLQQEIYRLDRYNIRCELPGSSGLPLRCDFRRLFDEQHNVIGNLFVFTDVSDSTDILTGFDRWDKIRRFIAENPNVFDHPTGTAIFDIVGLGEINQTFGRDVGDQRIRNLSRVMREALPEGTYFIRGHEAHLVAVCPGCTEEQMQEYAEKIVRSSAGTVLYGVSATLDSTESYGAAGESRNVDQAVESAVHAMNIKKLLTVKSFHSQTLTSLVRALQESDADTEAHVQRTQKMGEALGRRIGLTDLQLADLSLLCLLHDIGKIGIPLEILNKPGRLTDTEWQLIRSHAEKGYQIAMSSNELKTIAPMILYHHERWDGKGYPEKLSGTAIPLLSRVISIVDSYDAMVNNRSYRKALTPEQAQEEIRKNAGRQFDPYLADQFLKMLEENPEIALGEQTEGGEVRVFVPAPADYQENGNTFPIHFSRYLLDLDDTIIETDEVFEEITGYSSVEAVGRLSQADLIPPGDKSYYLMQVNNAFAKGDIAFLKHELLRKDGSVVWVVCFGKRYYDSAEKAFRSEILIFRATGGLPNN